MRWIIEIEGEPHTVDQGMLLEEEIRGHMNLIDEVMTDNEIEHTLFLHKEWG